MGPNPDEARRLLVATHRGHEPSARALWELLGGRLVALADAVLGRARGGVSGADIVQSVFCAVLSLTAREAREIRDPGAWLARGVRNRALNARRDGARRDGMPGAPAPRATGGAGATPDEELRAALDGLDEDEREIVVLHSTVGLTFDQAADVLGVARSTLASRHERAIARLRRALESPMTAREGSHAGRA